MFTDLIINILSLLLKYKTFLIYKKRFNMEIWFSKYFTILLYVMLLSAQWGLKKNYLIRFL